MTELLASVRNLEEARLAVQIPIGILDMKDPEHGALGALDEHTIRKIVQFVAGRNLTSATIGDLPPDSERISQKIQATATLGVDYIKIGLSDSDWLIRYLPTLQSLTNKAQLVGVLFADHFEDLCGPCHLLKAAGFKGAMVDTEDKNLGSLRTIKSDTALQQFTQTAQKTGLLCGLAGSLQYEDIDALLALSPNYLGFRSALCVNNQRATTLSMAKIKKIASRLNPPSVRLSA